MRLLVCLQYLGCSLDIFVSLSICRSLFFFVRWPLFSLSKIHVLTTQRLKAYNATLLLQIWLGVAFALEAQPMSSIRLGSVQTHIPLDRWSWRVLLVLTDGYSLLRLPVSGLEWRCSHKSILVIELELHVWSSKNNVFIVIPEFQVKIFNVQSILYYCHLHPLATVRLKFARVLPAELVSIGNNILTFMPVHLGAFFLFS